LVPKLVETIPAHVEAARSIKIVTADN